MPNRVAFESHQLTHIPYAPWCRACGAEKLHISAMVELKKLQRPRQSCRWAILFLGLTDTIIEGTTPTLVLCDGTTTYSLGLMLPRKGPVRRQIFLRNQFVVRSSCRTPFEELTMSKFQRPLLNFGEAVLAKESGSQEGKLGLSWDPRIWTGRTCQTGDPKSAVVVGLPHNSLKSLLH